MTYQINFSKLNEMSKNLDLRSMALLIVIAEFNRSVEEEEVFAKVDEYGLEDMNDEELLEWIENWKAKYKHLLN